MPSVLKVNDASTWRTIRKVYVNDGGTWRPIKKIYVNDSGTWRTVFIALSTISSAVDAQDNTRAGLGGTGTARFTFNSDGSSTVQVTGTATSWLVDGAASEVEVKFDQTSIGAGTFTALNTLGTWNAMTAARWVQYSDTNNDSSWVGTYTFREISTGTVLGTGTVTLSVAAAP